MIINCNLYNKLDRKIPAISDGYYGFQAAALMLGFFPNCPKLSGQGKCHFLLAFRANDFTTGGFASASSDSISPAPTGRL